MPKIPAILSEALNRSEGYCDLQMWEAARNATEDLPEELRIAPDAVAMRLNILMGMQEWQKASMLGMGLCERWPARVDFRLMTTQCLKNSGPAEDALEFMQSSPPAFWDH